MRSRKVTPPLLQRSDGIREPQIRSPGLGAVPSRRVQFLPADMAAALTFLNVAEVTQSEDSCKRNRQNALSAYQTVVRLLPRVTPSDEEQLILDEKLCELGNRLVELKLPIHPSNIEPSPG